MCDVECYNQRSVTKFIIQKTHECAIYRLTLYTFPMSENILIIYKEFILRIPQEIPKDFHKFS